MKIRAAAAVPALAVVAVALTGCTVGGTNTGSGVTSEQNGPVVVQKVAGTETLIATEDLQPGEDDLRSPLDLQGGCIRLTALEGDPVAILPPGSALEAKGQSVSYGDGGSIGFGIRIQFYGSVTTAGDLGISPIDPCIESADSRVAVMAPLH